MLPMRIMLLLLIFPAFALAQAPADWKPERQVELIIGAAPGGANDRIGRAIQRVLQESSLANPVIVVNKPGAGQTIAMAYLASHTANPHYIGLASSSWLTTIAAGPASVTHRDVTPIIKVIDEYQVYFVRNDAMIHTGQDILERLKKDPASVSFGFSPASGNPLHISIATLARLAGADPTKLTTVVYTSGTNTAVQVAGGHLDVGVQSAGSALALAQAGKIRLVAVAGPRRLPGGLANVPTLREQGINSDAYVFYVLFAPKGIEPAQLAWWDRAITGVMQSEQLRKDAEFNRWTIDLIGSRELPAFLDREYENYRRVLGELGLRK